MSILKSYITLGSTSFEITPAGAGDATELIPKSKIVTVIPLPYQEKGVDNTDWTYPYDSITIVRLTIKAGRMYKFLDFELQSVLNQSGWNGGTLADLQQAISDINTWLPSSGPAMPVISVSPSSRTFSNTALNAYSSSQTITVSGANLVDDITITAPSGFIVNLDGSNTNASPLVLAESGGTVSSTTVYIKYHPTSTGSDSGGVSLTSSGAVTKNVAVSGNCPLPNLVINPLTLSFGDMSVNDYTTAQTFDVEGTWLQGNIVITAPTDYIINLDGSNTNSSPITLTQSGGSVATTTIYVKFHPLSAGVLPENITIATTGTTTQQVAVDGEGIPPYITSDAIAITNLNYTQPGPSAASPNFSITGEGFTPYLSGTITFTCSTNLQVSKDGVTWGSSTTVTYTNGSIATAEIFSVRLKSGLSTGSYNETLTITGGGATPYVIPCTGSVIGVPDIVVSPSTLSFADTPINTESAQQTFTVSGSWLLDDITVTPPTGFKISLTNGSGYSSTPIVLSESGGTVASTTIYTVFAPTAITAYTGNIACTSSGATTENVAVDGDGVANASITVSTSSLSFADTTEGTDSAQQSFNVSGTGLTASLVVTPPTGFKISLTSGSGYSSSAISLTPSSGTVSSTPIYVVFAPVVATAYSANIACTSTGATTKNVAGSGQGTSTLLTKLTASYSLNGNATKNVGTYDGTTTNVTYTTGTISGQCAYFNGTGRVLIADSSDYTTSTSDFALSIRVKRTLTSAREIFHGQSNVGGQDSSISFILEFQADNKIRFLGVKGPLQYAIVTSVSTITDTNWHNIVIQRNGNNLELYIDSTTADSIAANQFVPSASLQDSNQSMGIGSGGSLSSNLLTGYIQDVHFSKASKFTSAEITTLNTKRYPFTV